jgi:hypothetical protein
MKQNKPTPKTGWLLIWRTMDLSYLEQENNVRRSERFHLLILQKEVFHNI